MQDMQKQHLRRGVAQNNIDDLIKCDIMKPVQPILWRCTQVGRRGAPAKGVGRDTGARVQISPSP